MSNVQETLGGHSPSGVPWIPAIQSELRGLILTEELIDVLTEAWKRGFTVQSNFAREQAEVVAMAASLGFITTRVMPTVFSRNWQITSIGLSWLESQVGLSEDPQEQ